MLFELAITLDYWDRISILLKKKQHPNYYTNTNNCKGDNKVTVFFSESFSPGFCFGIIDEMVLFVVFSYFQFLELRHERDFLRLKIITKKFID